MDLYGGKRLNTKENTVGAGINKTIVENKIFELGAGVYVTQIVKDFFNKDNINYTIGLTGGWKF